MSNNNIELDTILTRREDIPTTNIDGELGMMSIDKGKYFTLDEVGTRIWELLETPSSINQLVEVLMKEYDVDLETCQNDVKELIEKLVKEDLVDIQ